MDGGRTLCVCVCYAYGRSQHFICFLGISHTIMRMLNPVNTKRVPSVLKVPNALFGMPFEYVPHISYNIYNLDMIVLLNGEIETLTFVNNFTFRRPQSNRMV